MSRRASLPGADELFRATDDGDRGGASNGSRRTVTRVAEPVDDGASGRVSHDQKITVYLTSQELLDLEQTRLRLRAEFGIAVDRGRIVREAVAELLADLESKGPDAEVVRRLS